MKFEYQVLAFRQQPESPVQVAFVADSGDVLKWAGVPRKSDEFLTGYQRFKDERRIRQEVVPFFQDPKNCSPTAIILALRAETELGSCKLASLPGPSGAPIQTTLSVEIDSEAFDTPRLFATALSYVQRRLAKPESSASVDDPETAEDEDDVAEEEADIEDSEESSGESTDIRGLGTVTLARMKELLEDQTNWNSQAFRSAVSDYVKPANVIDGQHRLSAAAQFGERGLPFVICGLYDPRWEEQVFQFTVVNLKPKKIGASVITSIAALSLTSGEKKEVEQRLRKAGVKMWEVTIMSLVAYAEQSPFANLVDMNVQGGATKAEKLGYGSVKRIAREWFRARRTSLTLMAKELFETGNQGVARRRWQDPGENAWFEFFVAFWNAVRERFPEYWRKSPDNKLFIGAQLWALQEVMLLELDSYTEKDWHTDGLAHSFEERVELLKAKMLDRVRSTLRYFPEEVWEAPWEKTSQDTEQGRDDLAQFFSRFIVEGKKSGSVWRRWRKEPWFKQA